MRERWISRSVLPRLPGLIVGLIAFGLGIALMVQAGLGLGPWEAFHQGIGRLTGLEIGTVSILLGLPILALWWPLGERPGIGTLLNVVLIGTATNAGIALLPVAVGLPGAAPDDAGRGGHDRDRVRPLPRSGSRARPARRADDRAPPSIRLVDPPFADGGRADDPRRRLRPRRHHRNRDLVFALGIGPLVQLFLGIFDRDGRVARRRSETLEADVTGAE